MLPLYTSRSLIACGSGANWSQIRYVEHGGTASDFIMVMEYACKLDLTVWYYADMSMFVL